MTNVKAIPALILAALALFMPMREARATNIVFNGSFEIFSNYFTGWHFEGNYSYVINNNSAEGTNSVTPSVAWQDLSTVAGETYYLRFSARQSAPTLYFGGELVPTTSPTPSPGFNWFVLEGYAAATGSVTRLEVRDGNVDDFRAIATHDPVQILRQPESRAAYVGGTVTFSVQVDGGPPLSYAWLLDGNPVAGGTNAVLVLTHVSTNEAGTYSVTISNAYSSAVSSNATLAVEVPPQAPLIVAQPGGEIIPAGYAFNLGVVALGDAPLRYQWFLNGTLVPDYTNRTITFPALDATNAGTYAVQVQNDVGSALSLPATLVVTNTEGSGSVSHHNSSPSIRRTIYDVDGVTRLAGTNFFAQLYAGRSPAPLRAVGAKRPFSSGALAGYFQGGTVLIPDVPPFQTVYVQTRVWEAAAGVSYEDARARGGKFGASPVSSMTTVRFVNPPPAVPMFIFSLKAGLPLFTTGRLEVNQIPSEGPIEWKLTGAADATYLIEKRHPPSDWAPLLLLTNQTGTAFFTDTNSVGEPLNFYRSRILD